MLGRQLTHATAALDPQQVKIAPSDPAPRPLPRLRVACSGGRRGAKFRSGYSLRDALELIDQLSFRPPEKHELSHLFGNADALILRSRAQHGVSKDGPQAAT